MLLRFLLVSAVACLGVDLPTWRQAASDVRSSASWCGHRIAALSKAAQHPAPALVSAPAPAAAPVSAPAPEVCAGGCAEDHSPMPAGVDAFASIPTESPAMPTGLAAFVSDPIGAEPMPTDLAAFAAEPTLISTPAPAPEVTPVLAEAAPTPEPTPAPEPAPVVVAVDPDAGFQMVMTQTVNHFTADLAGGALAPAETALASIAAPSPAPTPAPAPTLAPELEPLPAPEAPAEDLYPGLAFELNHIADGLPEIWRTEPSPALAAAVVPTTPAEKAETAQEKTERLSAAIRLTGQAVHAWMSLLQAPSVALDEAASVSR